MTRARPATHDRSAAQPRRPVTSTVDRPVAAVGVSIPDAEQSEARIRDVIDRVKAAADTITSRLR